MFKLFLITMLIGCGFSINAKSHAKKHVNTKKKLKKKIVPTSNIPLSWLKQISVDVGPSSAKEIVSQIAKSLGIIVNFCDLPDAQINYAANDIKFIDFVKEIALLANWRIRINHRHELSFCKNEPYIHTHLLAIPLHLRSTRTSQNIRNNSSPNDSIIIKNDISDLDSDIWATVSKNLDFLIGPEAYTINRAAGMIVVRGTQKQHEEVYERIEEIRSEVLKQMVLRLTLLLVHADPLKAAVRLDLPNLLRNSSWPGTLDTLFTYNQVNTVASMLEAITILKTIGAIKKMWTNTVYCLNNQWAFWETTRDEIFFRISSRPYLGKTNTPQINQAPKFALFEASPDKVSVGVRVAFCPSISDKSKDEMAINIITTVSSIKDTKSDPTFSLMEKKGESRVPILQNISSNGVLKVPHDGVIKILEVDMTKEDAIKMGFDKGQLILGQDSDDSEFKFIILAHCQIKHPKPNPNDHIPTFFYAN